MQRPLEHPGYHIFRVENWFRWVIDAHNIGYSDADILFVLKLIGVHEDMQRILEAEANDRSLEV